MKTSIGNPYCKRIVYCGGGTVAICEPDGKVIIGPILNNSFLQIQLSEYGQLFPLLKASGLTPRAIEFYHRPFHFEAIEPPDSRIITRKICNMDWPSHEIKQRWHQISHGAIATEKINWFLAARNISSQIEICDWNFFAMLKSYNKQTLSLTKSGKFKKNKLLDSGFSSEMHITATATFSALGTLRDMISKFAAMTLFGEATDIDAWAPFLKEAKKQKTINTLNHKTQNAEEWLKSFSSFRNFVVHSAPLAMIHGVSFIKHAEMEGPNQTFCQVKMLFPTQLNKEKLDSIFKKTDQTNLKNWHNKVQALVKQGEGVDVLEYLHDTFEKLLQLSVDVLASSPIRRMMPIPNGKSITYLEMHK